MTRSQFRLALALIASLLFHLLPFAEALLLATPAPPPPAPPLMAHLRPPELPPPPPLTLPEPPTPEAAAPRTVQPERKPAATSGTPGHWQEAVRQQFRQQSEQGLYYPAEAIALGIEGEVLVLVILDQAGHAVAARIEQSSGHPSLDNAALRAVRSLHSLPADAPRETLLPVRFKLR